MRRLFNKYSVLALGVVIATAVVLLIPREKSEFNDLPQPDQKSAEASSLAQQSVQSRGLEASAGSEAFRHGHYQLAYRELQQEAAASPQARFLLGEIYREGKGVARNPHRAIGWYLRAAEESLPDAQFALGMMFAYEPGLASNYSEAFKWFQMAAEHGHGEAQMQLAIMYGNGMGTTRNTAHAVAWIEAALANGAEDSRIVRTHLVAQATAEEMARAAEIIAEMDID